MEDGKVVLNFNCLSVPELKRVWERYQTVLPFEFAYHMVHPASPYSDLERSLREEEVTLAFMSGFHKEDIEIIEMLEVLKKMWVTPIMRYYESVKTLVDKLAVYNENVLLDDSKETGNMTHVLKIVKECGTAIETFNKARKTRDAEVLKLRGKTQGAYDIG